MAPHSSTLAWKIPWTEEPGGLQSIGKDVTKCPMCDGQLLLTLQKFKKKPPDIIQNVRKIRNA